MKTEVPLLRRCCFCVPLRYGLLLWSYLTLVPNILLFVQDIFFLKFLFKEYDGQMFWAGDTIYLLGFLCKFGNFVFTVLLIIAAHRKSIRLLKIYYISGLSLVMANLVVLLSDTLNDIFSNVGKYISERWFWASICWSFLMGIILLAMQLYIIALVRSEIRKLENNQVFEFSNMAAAAESAYYEPETIKIEDKNIVITDKKDLPKKELII